MTTVSAERLASIFVEFADTLVDEFDLIEFLHMLTDRTADLVGAAAVGLVLADKDGRLEFMAGSDENVELLELFQLQTHEGPCLEAFRTGQPVINVNLGEAAPRWPRFAPHATAAGFQSVHAFPMRLRHQTIGALNLFGDTTGGDFDNADVPIVQALADVRRDRVAAGTRHPPRRSFDRAAPERPEQPDRHRTGRRRRRPSTPDQCR